MDIHCTHKELIILRKIEHAAEEMQMPCYLIGGFVRDKILSRPTKDADIVCLGDGIELAKKTAQYFRPVPEVNIFKNFGTAQLRIYSKHKPGTKHSSSGIPIAAERDGNEPFEIEFVGARTESYSYDSRK